MAKHHQVRGRLHFTADSHFGHRSQALRRGFEHVEEHDKLLVANWNGVVAPGDTVYHVGDFAYRCTPEYAQGILNRLHGRKILVLGNHDQIARKLTGWAEEPEHRRFIAYDGVEIVLDHYSGRTWLKSHHGSLQFFGHSHGRMPGNSQQLDVGVDCWSMMPTSLPQILERLATLPPFRDAAPDGTDDDEETPAGPGLT